uniref:Putative nonfluorescent protein n=1 Tax=Dryodora glandiformis TaxID=1566677 RepID=A0A1C8YXN5_9METZ|nr:putative nonfluorescent protein [Dryodora glandiformis]
MDHRMERAESMFTGTSRSKVIADIEFQPGTIIKVTGEGYSYAREGQQTLELNSITSLPVNFGIVGTLIQTSFRMYTLYPGNMIYDFFKTSFPGTMNVEMKGVFSDGMTMDSVCTLSFVNGTLICRCQMKFDNLNSDGICVSEELTPTLPSFENIHQGDTADEVQTWMDLVWGVGDGSRYSCRLDTVVKCGGNFAPCHHFIGHDFKLTEKSANNMHFAQKVKSRATRINYYKNSQ